MCVAVAVAVCGCVWLCVYDLHLTCAIGAGVGINHTVAVSVGFQSAFGDVKFTYDAAVLRGVFTQAALTVLNTEDENVATDNRRASLGQSVRSVLLVWFAGCVGCV